MNPTDSDTADDVPFVRLSRRYQAPPERVFRAVTDPDELAAWFWPSRFATEAVFDLRAGGSYAVRSTGLPEGQNMGVSGRIIEVRAPDRVVMSWRWEGEDDESMVTISVGEHDGGGSELVVTHDGLASAEARSSHTTGWADCLDRLGERLPAG